MLCALCSAASKLSMGFVWEFRHHPTYLDLVTSATSGCELCRFLKDAMLWQFSLSPDWTLDSADDFQYQVDEWPGSVPFVLQNHITFVDQDIRSAPFDRGCTGFHFIRQRNGDLVPVGDIWTFITLEAPRGHQLRSMGHLVSAIVPCEVDFSLARMWLAGCKENHKELCSLRRSSVLPTRVLDIGPLDAPGYIRLVTPRAAIHPYATLSHRWGQSKPLSLTIKSFETLSRGIPQASLPRTFRDAVTTTRQLGLRYLWIDSLCIFQDSREDWEKAVIEIPDIYSLAEVNICGPAAADSNSGFLHRRPGPLSSLDVEWQVVEGKPIKIFRLAYKGLPDEPFPFREPSSVLSDRGWILQERLLSSRILYLGSRQMYWECNTNHSFENLRFPILDNFQERGEVMKIPFFTKKSRTDWLRNWYELVITYSSTKLTYGSDRLPAISALARKFFEILQDEYMAGIWKSDMLRGLAWSISPWVLATLAADPQDDYIAPSWSWASKHCEIRFACINFDIKFHPLSTKLCDIAVQPKSQDPYGHLKSGYLRVKGRPFLAYISQAEDEYVKDRMIWKCSLSTGGQKLGTYYPDYAVSDGTTRKIPFLEVGYFTNLKTTKIVAMAISKSPTDPDVYYRCGLLIIEGRALSILQCLEREPSDIFKLV